MTETARLVIAVDSTQVGNAGADLSALERQAAKTEIGIMELAKAASKAYGALKLGSVITDAVTLSARYDQLGIVMSRVGQNTGRSTVELAALDQELQKAGISALQSRNNIIKMMSANIDLAQATKLARLAQDAAVIGNTNSSEAFERLIKGIQSAEKETLETLGLNVNFQQSYEKLAAQLGKNADQLTTAEKTQAGVNAAMEAGKNIAGAYEDSLGNANKALQSTTRYVENLMIKLGAPPQGAFKSAVDSYSEALQALDKNADVVIQVLETGLSVAIARGVTAVGTSTAAFIAETRSKQSAATASLALAQAEVVETSANLRATSARHAAFASHVEVTAAANAHAAAELKLAAAQKASSIASVAAASAGSRLLGLMGGPWGVVLTIGAAALSFLDFGEKAKTGMGNAASATEQAATRIRNATRNMLPGNLDTLSYGDIQGKLGEIGGQLEKAKKELDGFQKSFDKGDISEQWLTEPRERVAALEAAYQKLQEQASGARFASDKAGESYLKNLTQQAVLAGKVTEVEKLRASVQAGLIKLSPADLAEAEKKAAIADRETAALRAGNAAGKDSAQITRDRAKALAEFTSQSAITTQSTAAMADAYLAGADSVRELAIQQEIEEELLKTGAGARDAVTAAVNREADARDRLDIAKSISGLRVETEQLNAQAVATLLGTAALEAYNVQKAMQVALAGKNVAVGSQEYEQLLAATKAQQEAVKIAKQASDAGSIMDRLYPEKKLLREYTEAQAALNKAMELAPDKAAEYQDALRLLGLEYEQNKNAATAWGQFTEGALDRVDGAFADAWKNIGDGFDGFATSLKDGFKQLLAELAHMAITRPIVMQIGAALGVGGLSAQSGGLFGGGGGSGGLGLFDMASKAYGVATSGFGSAVSAGWSAGEGFLGGMQGAISGGYNYISSGLSGLFGGGAASSLAGGAGSNVGYGLGQSLVSGNIGSSTMATSSAGGLSASAPYLSAISGAIMGYQNSGVKGAAAGAAGGYLGVKGGAAVGSYFGPIGTAVGAVIGGILGSVGGSKLFGGDWVTKDTGLSLAVEDGDFLGKRYEYQKKKGGLFGKNKKRTRYSALDPEMQAALDATYDATEGSVLDLFDRLNVELNDGVLDGLNIGAQKISTKDKTAEEIQAEIAKWFGGVADSMVSAVDAATAAGLGGYNFEGLTAFVQNLEGVNEVVRYLNVGMYDMSVAGGKLAEQLSAIAGGLDVLRTNAATYYGAFIGESERMDDTLDAVTRAFVAANQTLPETRTGFRDMVESIDTTTQAGMQMFSTLMALSGQAATYYDILEQRAEADRQAAGASVNAAFAAVQRAVAAQQKAINKSLTDANSRISDLTGISNALGSALKQLRGTGDDAVRMLRSQAQATLTSALAIARAGGSLAGFAGLTDALDVLGSNNTDLYGSLEEFNRDQGRTANQVAELNKLNGKQLTAAEKNAEAMQAQLDALDQQLAFAQAQLDALNGVDNSVLSVTEAIKQMNAAVVAAISSISGKSTPANSGVLIDTIYKDVLGRDADAGGKQYWQDQLANGALNNQNIVEAFKNAAAVELAYKAAGIAMNEGAAYWNAQLASGALTPDQLQEAVRNAAIANGSIKAYATGGLISGPGTGTSDSILARLSNGEYVMSADAVRMFGTGLLDQMNAGRLPAFAQGGPVLDIPSPNQVFGSSRADVMSGVSDNRALLAKFEQLLEANKSQRFQIAKYAQQVAQLLQKWDVEGAPKERDYA
ncbi:hypothetical protein AL532_17935 [Pseudomonas monteilii]|uniref:DUF4214 domain-containing protein n=1 Tax=Pseudomonas monteilii TaxID=76759 RepID=UPI000CEB5227|nr:DUF4214 domain-containing protein [Pseudomonas monteilii]AVH38085.1 hypothetical protein AL532_17935 [Pseudomonas monteilii]